MCTVHTHTNAEHTHAHTRTHTPQNRLHSLGNEILPESKEQHQGGVSMYQLQDCLGQTQAFTGFCTLGK